MPAEDPSDQSALLQEILDRLRILETQSPLQASAIGTGGVQIYDGGMITVGEDTDPGQIVLSAGSQAHVRVGGSELFGDATRFDIRNMVGGVAAVSLMSGKLLLFAGGHSIEIDSTGVKLFGLTGGTPKKMLAIDQNDYIIAVDGGGGTGPHPPGTWVWPFPFSSMDGDPESEFGPRWGRFHEGMDFNRAPATFGADIHCAGPGTVEIAGYQNSDGFGYWVVVNHGPVTVLGGNYTLKTVYGHMNSDPFVSAGQQVTSATALGPLGTSGGSTGPHLHFETHLCPVGGDITWANGNPSWDAYRTAHNPRDVMGALAATGG